MIRQSARFASFGHVSVAALVCLSLAALSASAQQQVPAAPVQQPSTAAPSGPAPSGPPTFPKPDPANFTASSPSKEIVSAFLHSSWGYDETRVWQVQAIMKTPVEGIAKVVVFIGDKTGKQKPVALQFFVLQDGKHAIAGEDIVPFGEQPFADFRATLQKAADGPYRGSAAKDLELVEFADFQCPHCKDAQANIEKLAVDFPKARIVFQTYPLEKIHPFAKKSASYGYCVTKQGGSDAFFTFAGAVFEGQEGLATPDGATLTLNSAVTKAGLDPAKIAACAETPATSDAVEASVKLAQEMNINSTPTLMVNGRQVPIAGVPYDTLKQVVAFQAKLDGVAQ